MKTDAERGKYSSPDGSRTWEYLTALFGAIGSLCIGTLLGWNSPSLAEFRAPGSLIIVTSENASTLSAALSTGHMLALPVSVCLVDWIGRRKSILISAAFIVISWLMILLAEHVTVLIVARIMAGFGMGLLLATYPTYSAEVFSPEMRGGLGGISVITFYGGILFMFAFAPRLGVKITAGIGMGLSMICLTCYWFTIESPYFLVMKNRIEEAETALEKLRGKTDVAEEIELIVATIREKGKRIIKLDNKTEINEKEENNNNDKQSSFVQLLTIRGNLKALMLGLVLTTLQHCCGISTILSYCHLIFEEMGSGMEVYWATLIFSVLQIISSTTFALSIGKFKRKTLLLNSGAVSVFLLTVIATYFFLNEHTEIDVHNYGIIPLYSTFLLVMALNMGASTMSGIISSEIFSSDVKVLAQCIIGMLGSAIGICSIKSYLLMATSWGFGHSIPFYGYAVITLISLLCLWRYLPETKDKTLLEIQKELNA